MNCSCYIFGKFDHGYTQYPDDETKSMFTSCVQLSENRTQMVVHRQERLMFYTFIQKINKIDDSYIGLSVVISELMVTDLQSLFSILSNAITKMAVSGNLLDYNAKDIVSKVTQFYKNEADVRSVFDDLMMSMDRMQGALQALPPISYGINKDNYWRANVVEKKELLLKWINNYGFLVLTRDEDEESELSEIQKIIEKVPLKPRNKNNIKKKDLLIIILLIIVIIETFIIILIK